MARAWAASSVGVVLLLSACGGGQPSASPTPARQLASPTAAASVVPTVTAAPTPDSAAMQRMATAAAIPKGGLVAIDGPGRPKTEAKGAHDASDVCGAPIPADSDPTRRGQLREWSGSGWWVRNMTHVYGREKGTAVIEQIRKAAGSCKKYRSHGEDATLLGAVTPPSYRGVTARVGYCYQTFAGDTEYIACEAHFAKGPVVSTITVVHGRSLQSAKDGLRSVGYLAAKALDKAA